MLKNIKLVFITIFFAGFLEAQNLPLDPEFLSELPPELTETLLNNAEQREEKVEPFVTPNSAIQKINSSVDRIQSELDAVKSSMLRNYADPSENELGIFGEQFFSSFQTSFAPVNIASYDPDYILDYGDKLTIQLVGTVNKVLDMHIERDGSIMLLQVGKIQVSGIPLSKADEVISSRVAAAQIGTKSYVSLSAKRDMNILTIGAVEFPGMYTVSGGSSVLQVLDAAGGISDNGSYRNIELIRDNKTLEIIDLYDALIKGKVTFKNQLRSGDVISVKARLATIHVSGAVGYPAIYEAYPQENLDDIIKFALGVTSNSDGSIIYNSKDLNTNSIKQSNLKIDELSDINPKNGDYVFVPYFNPKPNKIRTVTISGEVNNPGQYSISPGEKLSSLLKRSGGYTDIAYPFGGVLTRETTKEIESQINDRIYKDMIKFIASNANAAQLAGGESFALILNEFRKVEPVGRVTAEFDLQSLENQAQLDLSLEDGDKIIIPEYDSEVYVLGEVLNPGARLYKPNKSGKDYIDISGGLGRYAEKNKSIIIHPNGDAFLLNESYLNFVSNNVDIYPGTIIYVPREIGKLEGINYAAVVAPIFSSLALSLASLNSINN